MKATQVELLRDRLDRIMRLIDLNAPDIIIERAAADILNSFTLLYPGLWANFGQSLQETLRNRSGMCSECGKTEIPALFTHPLECRRCSDANLDYITKNGVDPYEAYPPDVEEIMVDLTNTEAQKINNLPVDFLDALERAMESRAPLGE